MNSSSIRDRWQIENLPFIGLAQQKACQIVDVNALHYDDDCSRPLVVETGQQRIDVPLVSCRPLSFRHGVIRLERVIDDDDVAAAAGQCSAN